MGRSQILVDRSGDHYHGDMSTVTPSGPPAGPTNREGFGFVSQEAQRVELGVDSGGFPLNALAGVRVDEGHVLRCYVYPEQDENTAYAATFVAVDLVFDDESRLTEFAPHDQYGTSLTALAQGASKMLLVDQWNHVECDLSAVAGKVIARAELVYASPWGDVDVEGAARFSLPIDTLAAQPSESAIVWVDGPAIESTPEMPSRKDYAGWVDTRRGTHSTGDFARGNNLPITAWPNGFCFWAPVTNARTQRWPYEYHRLNGDDNRPRLQGVGISHQPSPWMGDRNQLFFMPCRGPQPLGDPKARALGFDHSDETARPDLYSVALDQGLQAEVAPTDHGGLLRIQCAPTPAEPHGDLLHLVIDSLDDQCGFEFDGTTVTGWVDNGEDDGRVRMFVVVEPSVAPRDWGPVHKGLDSARVLTFDPSALPDGTLMLRVATSFISVDQAKHNLQLELGSESSGSAELCERTLEAARAVWNERLGVIEVEGASPHRMRTLYGCLYRMNLYPNSSHENVGTVEAPTWKHASSVLEGSESTATHTGAQVIDGITYVNNGFWDTYRTMWPALSLLYPELAEGFIQQYREGGWVARWSSPGYADLMTGTSSDVAFADAYLRGVALHDPIGTYEAGLKNATVVPPHSAVGRKGMETSVFTGYTDTSVDESVSWALEGYINDHGLAQQARALADRIDRGEIGADQLRSSAAGPQGAGKAGACSASERAARLREDAAYLEARAANYRLLFDSRIGFFQGRNSDGTFAQEPEEFDPCVWGGDFTETDGWNFAFHAAHDPVGLAHLYGEPDGLKAKLDEFFSTPETATKYGTYGFTIHEMLEAQAVRMGQYGFSNQPAHHIAHMYNYAGDPHTTQEIVHEVLRRLFVGEQIGQGYPGDEDNGEMSAWYVLNALGIYPLRVGSPEWALASPLYSRATVRPLGGEGFDVVAHDWTPDSVYATSAAIIRGTSKTELEAASVDHADLIGSTLEFTMSSERPGEVEHFGALTPPALSSPTDDQAPLFDFAVSASCNHTGADLHVLVDDTSATAGQCDPASPVEIQLGAPIRPRFVTLTNGDEAAERDPIAVTVEGAGADGTWVTLRPRTKIRFQWRRQTLPFVVEASGSVERIRFTFEGTERPDDPSGTTTKVTVAQLEVLA